MSSSTSRADWGTTSGGPYPFSAGGTDYASPGGSFLHSVTLTGLTPGTRYYYRVGDGTMASSFGEASFRAALPNGSTEAFSFAAAGDWGNSSGTAATSNGIQARDPNLVLPLGDLYYSDQEATVKGVYDKWQAFGQGSFVQAEVGNHEYAGDSQQTPTNVYCAYVNQIGNERTYSFKFGNTLFLAIDWGQDPGNTADGVDASGGPCGGAAGNAAIRTWLDARLAAANLDHDITWKVVLQHFQCYDMTTASYFLLCPDGSRTLDQEEDILSSRGVDLVLFGHDHTYGRTHPVRFHTTIQTGSNYDTPGAPIYFDLGTGGASGTSTCRTDTWVASCRAPISTFGFGQFQVSPTTIQYKFVDNSAGVVDSFTLTKRPATDYAVSVDPVSGHMARSGVTTANVTVVGASSDPVTLSVSGCPANTTCTFSPSTGTPTFASTFRVQTSSTSPFGTFDLVISATNASLAHTVTLHLTISDLVSRSYQKGDGGSFSETDDLYIIDSTPNTNFGADTVLLVDGDRCIGGLGVCKTLIKFPSIIGPSDGQIPSGSSILSAILELNIKNTGDPMDGYQVTEAWTESGATWSSFATPGIPGNRGHEFTVSPNHLGAFPINVTSIVQRWANGDANQGIFLASSGGDGSDYWSSEASSNRPILRVSFFVPPPPPPPPSFDFSVSISPSSGMVPPGASIGATVTATLLSGSTHNVQYSCTNVPLGASCAFTPAACAPTCTANLVLVTSSSTPEGSSTMTIQATDGAITRSVGFTLTVQSLVLSYDMENLTGDGNMKDLSGYGRHGTIAGTTDVLGKVGRARHFNSGERITAPAIAVPATDFTVVAWFNWTTNPSPYYSGIYGGSGSWELRVMADGRFGATFYQSTTVWTDIVSPLVYNDGEWHHAAGVLRSGLAELYVDGVLVAQDTTNPITGVGISTQTVLGHVASDFVGDIDEVRVFSRALTGEEIAALAPPPPPPTDGLVLSYDMETLLPNGRMQDLSGSMHHGTITGTSDIPGKVGRARIFNPGDSIAGLGIPVPALNFTVAAWFNWTTNPSPYYSGIYGGSGSWELRVMADGRFGATFYQSTAAWSDIVSPLPYNDGEWHHAAGVLRSGLVNLYVDGVLVAQDTTAPISSVGTSTQTIVGHIANDLIGGIDEVRIFTRALSDAEIAAMVPPPPLPSQSLVLHYDMETFTGGGRMEDLSGQAHQGTMTGTTDVAGEIGRAREFDGVGDSIQSPSIHPGNNFTIAAWIFDKSEGAGSRTIVGRVNSYFLWIDSGSLRGEFYDGTTWAGQVSYAGFSAAFGNEWTHVAITKNESAGTFKLYINGQLIMTDSNSLSVYNSGFVTAVGDAIGWNRQFKGTIDEVLVFSRALTDEEIAAIAPPPPANGPVLQYDMETLLLDGRMKDFSGHVNHGAITGTTDVVGKIGRARLFNGGERITASPVPAPATNFTVAAWFNWTTNPSPYYSGIYGGSGSWELRVMADGRFGATFYQSIQPLVFTDILSPLTYNDGAWHHAAAVLRSGLVELYVDGVLMAQDTTDPITSVGTSTQTVVGHVASDFVGSIDEVRIFTRALTDAEVAALGQVPRAEVHILSYNSKTLLPGGAMDGLRIAVAPLLASSTMEQLGWAQSRVKASPPTLAADRPMSNSQRFKAPGPSRFTSAAKPA